MFKNVLAALLAYTVIFSANASPSSQVTAAARVSGGGLDTGWTPQTYIGATPGASSQAAMLTSGKAYGWASSGPGYAKAYADAYLTGAGDVIGFGAGSYYELITLHSSGLEGQTGRLTVNFLLDYDLNSLGTNAISSLHFSAGIGNSGAQLLLSAQSDSNGAQYIGGFYETNDALGYSQVYNELTKVISVTSNFTWGSSLSISYRMLVQAQAFGELPTGAVVDAAHSAYWGGISSIQTNGQSITDFTVMSESGADYSKSFAPTATDVPEPSTIPLMFLGIATLLAATSRRHPGEQP